MADTVVEILKRSGVTDYSLSTSSQTTRFARRLEYANWPTIPRST
jgi:glutaredoxin-related protein